jgi:hypothetical protein
VAKLAREQAAHLRRVVEQLEAEEAGRRAKAPARTPRARRKRSTRKGR